MTDRSQRESYVSSLTGQYGRDEACPTGKDKETIIWTEESLCRVGADTIMDKLTAFTALMLLMPSERLRRRSTASSAPTAYTAEDYRTLEASSRKPSDGGPSRRWGFCIPPTRDVGHTGLHIPRRACLLPAIPWLLHHPSAHADPESLYRNRFSDPAERARVECPCTLSWVVDHSNYSN